MSESHAISAGDFRTGLTLIVDGDPWQVLDFQHVKPGKGAAAYLSLGTVTDNPVPGDIIVYSGHVAIYIGNGQAVHGGWLGNQTVISTVECDRPFIAYVHVTK